MSEFLELGAVFLQVALGFILLIASLAAIEIIKGRKSQAYRKELADMYVASKTRLLAKEDGLDLDKEKDSFKDWLKKDTAKDPNKDLDNIIEQELKEKVSEPIKKK